VRARRRSARGPMRRGAPQDSPLYRVLADHFAALERVHEERFEPTHGPLRAAARQAASRFLDCGLLEHGFARVRCGACWAEFLVAFRCKGRHFCPSCHARRLAEWSLWLDERLLAPVPHRQVVLTLPKRLRAYFVHHRRRLGLLSRLATRTLRDYVQAALGEREAVPGVIACGVGVMNGRISPHDLIAAPARSPIAKRAAPARNPSARRSCRLRSVGHAELS